jgi:hypothetical protein
MHERVAVALSGGAATPRRAWAGAPRGDPDGGDDRPAPIRAAGLRRRDIDRTAQRIRVRNTFVRGEHSGEGHSDLSTRRSLPMTNRLARARPLVAANRKPRRPRSRVFAHPQTGNQLDRSKATKRFQAAYVAAVARPRQVPRPSPRDSPRVASRCARSKSSAATPITRRHGSAPTTHRPRTRSTRSTTPSRSQLTTRHRASVLQLADRRASGEGPIRDRASMARGSADGGRVYVAVGTDWWPGSGVVLRRGRWHPSGIESNYDVAGQVPRCALRHDADHEANRDQHEPEHGSGPATVDHGRGEHYHAQAGSERGAA